jgi:Ca-activated chloride channel family protein
MKSTRKKIDVEELLSATPAPAPPEDLAAKICAGIPREMPHPASVVPVRPMRRVPVWARAAAVAAAVLFAGYAGLRLAGRAKRPPIQPRIVDVRTNPAPPPAPSPPPVIASRQQVPGVRPSGPEGTDAASRPKPGTLEGRVTDEQGGALPGASVTIAGRGGVRTAITDAGGRVAVPIEKPGKYRVESSLLGFETKSEEVRIASGETARFQAPLRLRAVAQTVTVSSEAPVVDKTNAKQAGVEGGTQSYDLDSYQLQNNLLRSDPSLLGPAPSAPPPPSTGGTEEPNDQPYGDVFFHSAGVNPFVDTEDDALSTFGLDVDTASYAVARRYLSQGNLPPAEAIRVEEFVNSFDYGDAPPARGDFAIVAEAAPAPFARGERYRLVRFHLQAKTVDPRDRKAAVLTFVVDVSGSMQRENRLELVKHALGLLLDRLRPSDRVGLVVFGSSARVLLEPTGDLAAIRRAIEFLQPEGATNTEEGLRLGYALADRYRRAGGINRVILCSDGVANVGRTGPDSILPVIEREAKSGIELTTVGFGMGNFNDVLMEQLADRGNGRYAYVDTLEEARRIFVENLTGTLQTLAFDAKAQVEFDPAVVSRWRLLGYENRDIADEKFRDDRVDAGEIGAGHGVTALYEIKLAEGARSGTAATLRLRYRSAETDRVVEVSEELRLSRFSGDWETAPRSLRLAGVVAQFAEILRGSYWAKEARFSQLLPDARRLAAGGRDTDAAAGELLSLIEEAARLQDARREPPAPEE